MRFQPYPHRSGFIFLSSAIILTVVIILFVRSLLQQQDPRSIFILLIGVLITLALVMIIFYWTLVAFRLNYHLNRNGLAIQWGLGQQLIPFELIRAIVPGKDVAETVRFKSFNIAGLRFGGGELPEYGRLKFRATASLAESLLIITDRHTYIISPDQPNVFVQAWQARQSLGPTQHWTESMRRYWPLNVPLLADRLTWALWSIAALCCLALLGYICINYSDFPGLLPVHFNNLGQADRIADKNILFTLPAVGGFVWLVNFVIGSLFYRQERVAAYLLWGSTIAMQLCLWIAALTITA
jgi:hypothetical protein